ncbi:MAG: molybdate ABC transporter permease subunit [Desulfovibrio sp.]|jgi:molybdate transport system permease protein|nr:molybdate ABC transporter permease subunit [Desulfovibrio sp.]
MSDINDPLLFSCILLTVKVAGLAAAVAGLLGVLTAWFLSGRRAPARSLFFRVIDSLCALPLVLPPTVIGYCLILLLGRRGIIGQWLAEYGINLIFSWQGAVVAATVVIFPLCYRSARAALESVDHTLEDTARTLGATEARVFFRISLPLARRGIFAGITLAFARGMGEFGATLMIAGNLPGRTQTLSLAVYDAFQSGNDHRALILVLVASGVCASLLVIAETVGGMGLERVSPAMRGGTRAAQS